MACRAEAFSVSRAVGSGMLPLCRFRGTVQAYSLGASDIVFPDETEPQRRRAYLQANCRDIAATISWLGKTSARRIMRERFGQEYP
jgi:hypothetical protein